MSEKSTFIRYALAGALTVIGLLLPCVTATAVGASSPKRAAADAGGPAAARAPQAAQTARTPQTAGPPRTATTPQAARLPHTATPQTVQAARSPRTPQVARAAHRLFRGRAFDTCQAPALATMRAWRAHSTYRAAGIYFGGRARACTSQRHLTPNWVRQTTDAGWSLLPIYVGSQSPCVTGSHKNPYRIDPERPTAQGADEGTDAVEKATALGLAPGSALYLDMESYDADDASCATATLAFVRAWDEQVQARGYLSGFYSSADSGIRHMEQARRAGTGNLPDVVWYARWGVPATLTSEPVLRATAWTPHARIHQYTGSVTESHGGKKLTIDCDLVDAPVAVVR